MEKRSSPSSKESVEISAKRIRGLGYIVECMCSTPARRKKMWKQKYRRTAVCALSIYSSHSIRSDHPPLLTLNRSPPPYLAQPKMMPGTDIDKQPSHHTTLRRRPSCASLCATTVLVACRGSPVSRPIIMDKSVQQGRWRCLFFFKDGLKMRQDEGQP